MYHALIRSKLTQTLEGLNKDNFEESLAGMDTQIEHYFAGTHAIGVEFTLAQLLMYMVSDSDSTTIDDGDDYR